MKIYEFGTEFVSLEKYVKDAAELVMMFPERFVLEVKRFLEE